MVHQHFKLVQCFTVLENIILGVESTKNGVLQMDEARKKVKALSEKYGLQVNTDNYYVVYEAFASNVPPTINVIEK